MIIGLIISKFNMPFDSIGGREGRKKKQTILSLDVGTSVICFAINLNMVNPIPPPIKIQTKLLKEWLWFCKQKL